MTGFVQSLRARPTRAEAAAALTALAAGQIEVWASWVEDEQGPRWLAAVAMAAMALSLLWYRRAPLVALGAVCVIYLAWAVASSPNGPLVPLLIVLVAVFSVAARQTLRLALLGLAGALAALSLVIALTLSDLTNYLFVDTFILGAWAAGRVVHGRQRRADEMEGRAIVAEREREARARVAVLEERARIARELHDIVSHSVGVMVIQAQAAQQRAGADAELGGTLHTIETTGQQALGELRRLLGLLRRSDEEPAMSPQPGLRHLAELVDSVRRAGLPVTVDIRGDPVPLPPGVDLSAYRVIQEALTNSLKHAGHARARVVVSYASRELDIEISDDGSGAVHADNGGHGLAGMRERVSVYGGSLTAGSRPEGGYALRARLPFEPVGS